MRLAAIDIGTNSVHMIVVRVRPDRSFEVIDREKEMVRLGAGGLDGKAITDAAFQAALVALTRFKRLADSRGVDRILAAATSATREAENGPEFLAAIARETGIRPRVISGTEEARLIHRAAVYGVNVGRETAVVIDIGGGSVEVTAGTASDLRAARSFKIGVIRLAERFVASDPLAARDERRLVQHVRRETARYLRQIVRARFDRVIGTSGTILSLGAMAAHDLGGAVPDDLRNLRVPAEAIHRIRDTVTRLPLDERLALPGLEARRADLVVAGAVLLDTLLQQLRTPEITLCDLALREGLILDYIARHRKDIVRVGRYPDVRRRSVVELAERCGYHADHARQIARLSLSLFDQTTAAHGLGSREREWLEYAALLHDIGVHISYPRHHRHSDYLIRHGDLRGFDPLEITVMGLVARYHRQAEPKKSHREFGVLAKPERRAVRALSAILRLAEGLDRSHQQAVRRVRLVGRGDHRVLHLISDGDVELELWAGARHAGPFARLLGGPVTIELAPPTPRRSARTSRR